MYTQFEEKGKIFTNVVTKKPVRVIIQTTTHRIEGNIHVRPDLRLIDALKSDEPFLAVTEATVYSGASDEMLYETKFVSINQQHVIWVLPVDELMQNGGQE